MVSPCPIGVLAVQSKHTAMITTYYTLAVSAASVRGNASVSTCMSPPRSDLAMLHPLRCPPTLPLSPLPSRCPLMNTKYVFQRRFRTNFGNMNLGAPLKTFRPGDWKCSKCGAHNYRSRLTCYSCNARPPEKAAAVSAGGPLLQAGDWECACGQHNFRGRRTCHGCNRLRPEVDLPSAADVPLPKEHPENRKHLPEERQKSQHQQHNVVQNRPLPGAPPSQRTPLPGAPPSQRPPSSARVHQR